MYFNLIDSSSDGVHAVIHNACINIIDGKEHNLTPDDIHAMRCIGLLGSQVLISTINHYLVGKAYLSYPVWHNLNMLVHMVFNGGYGLIKRLRYDSEQAVRTYEHKN